MKNKQISKALGGKTGKDLLNLVGSKEKRSHQLDITAPSGEDEVVLHDFWKTLLAHDRFGVHDDFFQVGGNSLKAIQLLSRISSRYPVKLQLTDIFLQPTIARLAALIIERKNGHQLNPSIAAGERPALIPLSFNQERLWFIDQLEGSVAYHIPAVLRLKGTLDKDALFYAFRQIINRHEILRTQVRQQDGKGYQVVREKDQWELTETNGEVYGNNEERLQSFILELIGQPFDLAKDDMIRVHLIKINEAEHVLVITLHHIASDGWSTSVIIKELVALYEARKGIAPAALEPLSIQYADFAIWQRAAERSEVLDEKLAYWKEQLDSVSPLQLQTDHPRPAVQSGRGAVKEFTIDKELSDKLQQLGTENGATVFMTLLAVLKVLLHRYSNQQDITVGTAIAGRQQQEVEDLVGFFVNTLALRTRLNTDQSFTELLQQIRSTTLQAYEHQEVPFEKVVEAVVKDRDMSRSPLFQVMFVLQSAPVETSFRLGEVELTQELFETNTSKFDLDFSMVETPEGLQGSLEYCTDLYNSETVDRLLAHFKRLLVAVVETPGEQLGRLKLMSSEEQNQLLVQFNNNNTAYPKTKSIVSLFEEQVLKTPGAIALIFEEQQLNYHELNERSNRLAHYLLEKGVMKQALVPVCIERGIDLMVAIIAILKAGGAYVPVDAAYPADRIQYILSDIDAKLILTSKLNSVNFNPTESLDIIEVDGEHQQEINGRSAANTGLNINPRDLAYVIYTSGSTGKPKGVLVQHQNVVSLVKEVDYVTLSNTDILLSTGSPSFDATTFEYWGMLLNGGQLVLCSEDRLLNSELLKQEIITRHVNKMWFTSSWFNQLVDTDIELFKDLDTILVGGEKLSEKHIEKLFDTYPAIDIINGYGPTENTTFSLTYKIQGGSVPALIPIGKPLNNRKAYILDALQQLVPIGVPGEICLSGDGIARGYLNRPELTAEKFIANVFDKESGNAIYKTGDLGRWLPDGNIEYLGRIDDQVKIRGYRIELGEIEAVLQESKMVSQCVVFANENNNGEKRLIGYLVINEGNNKKEIAEYLKGRLPEYMIPAVWVEMEKIPLTANGKIDKKALPGVDAAALLQHEYVAPRNEQENRLAAIWKELLNVERVGIHDNFFELGGHSLLAMRLIASISKEMGIGLGIKSLFLHPTIAELATYLQLNDRAGLSPAIQVQERPVHVPLSFSQERLWFIDQLEGSVQYHLPSVFRLRGSLHKDALIFALQSIINRHEVLRTVILEEEGHGYQFVTKQDQWSLNIIEDPALVANIEKLQSTIQQLIDQPFNLSKDHMLRAHLISLNAEEHVLVVIMHHIASDAWSLPIIMREVAELYEAAVQQRAVQLQPLPVQYADYAIWQRQVLQGEAVDTNLQYWKKKLDSVSPLQLPTDFTRPLVQSTRGALIEFDIDEALSAKLHALSRQEGATLFMTLLSAFNVLLHRYSGQLDITVGSPVANRTQHEVENLVGFFVNSLALRTDLSDNPSFTKLLQQVKLTTLEAYDHQELPFEKVVDAVVKQRDMSRSPLFQVMFVLQNEMQQQTITMGDVKLSAGPFAGNTSKFELIFNVTDTPNGFKGSVEYCTDLYIASTVHRMIGHFKQLLQSIAQTPAQPVSKLHMLPGVEVDQLLVDFNDTYAAYPKDKTIVDLIEEQVEKTPGNIAVVFNNESITYRELNERSNRLAHYLRGKGVVPDMLIPVCLERTTEMIVAIVGILKAGGAYVPIDPEYPAERIQYMLEDTGSTIVVAGKETVDKIRSEKERVIILLDSADALNDQPANNLEVPLQPHHLAYVIYTSGSTGKPKGVLIEHRNIVRLFKTESALYDFNENDVWSVFHSFCFDFSVWEMYGALFYGGRMVIVPKDVTKDVSRFAALLLSEKVTVLNQTPSAFYVLQEALVEMTKEVPVRFVIFGGEALNPAKLQPWKQAYPGSKLINMYGITETTVHVTYQEIEWQHMLGGKSIIGKPIPTLSAYILDSHQNLVPIGVAGELLIGGAGLARGYLNRPELTAERFIPDPFSKEPGARLYRTGDAGLWLPDGNIEYLGRIDEQVKIRGYRIELGEIETVLHECSLVRQAVVLAKADREGNKRLVGYIVPEGAFNREAIVSFLQAKLPDYMVPALWVELEKLPLTPNGKTDKKALPEPDASGQLEKQFVAPTTEDELKVAAAWKEILNVERVGIHDNFFELGGDSIKVIRVVNKLKKAFNKDIKVFDIYHAGTLHQLLPVINNSASLDNDLTRISIKEELQALKTSILPTLANAGEIVDVYPMSDIQNGMVYASLINPGLAIYHDQFAYPLAKDLNKTILEKAIHLLIEKHDIFRTAFNLEAYSEGLQVVYRSVPLKVEYIYVEDEGADADAYVKQFLAKERRFPFDVTAAPLWRFAIIHFADHNEMVFQVHHALLDGWSVASFNTELNNLYLALLNDPGITSLPVLKVTYKDFIIESLADRQNNDNRQYWQQELADYKRLDIFSTVPASQKLNRTYGAEYLAVLDKKTKQDGISLKGLFFGAYLYSLSMLTPEDELTVGVVSNTRPVMEDGEKLLGCFLNTIPARVKTSPKAGSWKEFFESAENKLVELKQRDRATLMQITNITGEKTQHENPFFDALYSFINFHVYENFENGLLQKQQEEQESMVFEDDSEDLVTNTYLNFIVIVTGKVLKVHYRLRQRLKSGKSLEELNRYFDRVISCYLDEYENPISRNSIIDKTEQQLLLTNNDNKVAYPKDKTVVSIFEEQVSKTPTAIALVFDGATLTYQQLNERANQLAHYLRSRAVKEESLVPICMERGLDMMVGILGVLKAGAAYVPIDAAFPADRIAYMLEDSGSPLLLCNSESRAVLDIETGTDIIEIDELPEIQLQSTSNPQTNLAPQNAAYVIYTSGSTGQPKGVVIEHRNLLDYTFGLNDKVQINDCRSFALVSTIATDLGNTVIYASLLSGGALHIFSKDATTNVEMLHEYFTQHTIDCLKIVPSHWKAMCMDDQLLLPTKLLVFGGEALRSEIVDDIRATGSLCRVVNHYGPTETTIGKLLHLTEPGRSYGATIPIGKPFSNTQVYVLNKEMELSPIGVPGQLFIAGDGVARGYFNKPDITKEKFITDPFSTNGLSQMYGTGDLVKYLPDGNIEFIGRVDDQVKIRGYRIELGEIETVMNECEQVSQAVVLAREDKQGNKRLVAYIVAEGYFERDEIMSYLKEKLPEYMVPALLVELESLPLTANGKIDRKALPDPDIAEMQTSEYAAPRNPAETALAAIWQELLDVEAVGIHDNFFELGGDSIITIQLVSRARRAGYELQMGDVFTYQTIARLSALLDQRADTSAGVSGEQFILEGASGLLPIQQWFFDKDSAAVSHFNQTVLLGIDKEITESFLKRAVEQLTAHHDALRFKYYKKEGQWFQVYEHQSEVNRVFTEDLQYATADTLSRLITDYADRHQRSLDIEKGELVKFVLLQTPGTESLNRLLIVIHHLAIDGVSWRILLEDLDLLLGGFKTGGQTDLGKKTSSYRQWFETLEKYGQDKKTIAQKTYWNKVVENYHSLPVDKPFAGDVKIQNTHHYGMRLDALQTRKLTHDVPRVYHTEINDILMAALAKTLAIFSGNQQVTIGMEGHGREAIEPGVDTSRTIGWFTTHYPILLDLQNTGEAGDLIKSVKEQLRTVPDKGLGFGVLKYINKEPAYQGKKVYDLVFNYLGQADNVLNAGRWLSIATESAGADRSEEYFVTEKLAVNGMVQGGELFLNWTYSDLHYEQKTVISLVNKFKENLQVLIDHCIAQQSTAFTPSDYGLSAEINYKELDHFLNEPFHGKPRKESLESMYRLSGLQQGMLFHGLYDEGGSGYINHFWCDLLTPDLGALRKSWNEVLRSHTILRSAFYHDAFNLPVQVVYREIKLPIEIIDYRGKTETEQVAAQKQFEEADKARGFNFKQAPLMRITLLRLSEDRYRMLWSSHHILFDGWSRSILMGEFLKIYESLATQNSLPLIAEDRYEDYIRYIELIDKDNEQAFWKGYLQNVTESTLLPFIGATTERNKGLGEYGAVILDINKETTGHLERFAQRHRLTMNTLMQGVWSYLLHRYTGSNEIVYGVIVSGRPDDLPHVEQRIGMFINALPLHSSLKEDQPVAEWLQQIQAGQVAARNYQYTPLHEIQSLSGVQGDLFDSLLVFENYPISKVLASMKWNLEVENVTVIEQTNYPLSLIINSGEEINIDFNYNKALLSEEQIRFVSGHFENVLQQLATGDEGRINDLKLVTAKEADQLVKSFNDTNVSYPEDQTVLTLFGEQVAKTPDAVALQFEEQQLTYSQLDERSNQLAHYLVSKGVKRETLVPICIERSINMVIGILGILKAGGAYVPIDPEYPAERISYMLEDTGATVIVTSKQSNLILPLTHNAEIIELESVWDMVGDKYKDKLPLSVQPQQLAYVIYTSGSTGKPKGVMIEHRNVFSFISWSRQEFSQSVFDIAYASTSICFDLSIFEIFYPLSIGKPIRILESGLDIGRWLANDRNVLVNTVPVIVENLLKSGTDLASISVLNMAGEPIPSQVSMALDMELMEVRNLYGPTEDTTYSTVYRLQKDTPVLIGKPVANTIIYITGKEGSLVPVGIAGEICISGDGLARGYLNRPELTDEKFITNPFSKISGCKMYRTGDLGRWMPDGNIEYLGRIDDQVKIRGYRIELGEIEAVLQQSGLVKSAVVMARPDNNGTKRLVGYIVPGGTFNQEAIAAYMRVKLPNYMVPAIWVPLESLPLTPNGKIDKKALPEPGLTSLAEKHFVAATTAVETYLTKLWQEILNVQQVGIHDNFFELGGHSLLAMRLISAVRRQLDKEINIKMVFLYPTIEELAAQLELQEKGSAQPAIIVHERPEHIPLSFSQERLWFIDKLEGTLQYHLPSIIRMKGKLNIDALTNTLQQIVNRHEVLRTVILEDHGAGYQHIQEKDKWQLNIVDGLVFTDGSGELQQYIKQLVKQPFNLSSDYLLRAHLISVSETEYILVVTMHHIAADGWSTSIIVKELMELYAAYEEERPAQLSPLTIQYADYAIWQRNYLQADVLDRKLAYWKNKLDGVATLQLPTDFSRPAVQSSRGTRTVFTIEKELADQLISLSQQQGSTLFMTLVTAYKIMLHRYSGQQDICVGTPVANRTQLELESLVGFFINTLALRSDLAGNPTFTSLLQQVKTTILEAYEHQDMPFEKIVEVVVKERDMSRNPLFQVLFTMQNTPEVPELRLGNIHLSLEEQEHTTSQLDIICNITETKEGLFASVEYCTDLYTEQTIRQMMVHFREILRSVVKSPSQKIGELHMLTGSEEQQLLNVFNDTSVQVDNDVNIVQLFEAQVIKNPHNLAVVFKDDELTYLQLNERVNQLAAFLKLKGVKEEKMVPVCTGRSLDMLVGILAILKAGGAYVPIDPDYPGERISYMLEDTKATVVLCSDETSSRLPGEDHLNVISIDGDWPLISTQPVINPIVAIRPEQLAYVIYTSGSTGKPKGVLVEHRNMLSYLINDKTRYITGDTTNAGSFVHLSYTFDASLTAMFMPLLAGKSVVIGSKASLDVFEDTNLNKYAPYDFIKITPAHLALLQPKIKTANGSLLTKRLVLGGEALFMGQFSDMVDEGVNVEIINEYGPTEATVGCSVFSFQTIGGDEQLKSGISIGKPIDNVQLFILGAYNELVPLGAAGELCIGGAGLARGYLNQPELTAEKFIKDSFDKTGQSRIYKTGDLARWLPDGNIEYLGRKDEQVKIRGYRIELGEIESVLQDCRDVKQAVVLARDNKEGSKRLVAYVVPLDAFEKEAILDYMKNILPEYMIPVQWVEMESLPLTSNGKIDRKALPDPDASESLANEYVAPRNEFEIALAEIWKDLLDVEEVGIHDNFFELGGDSIIIIQIVSRARRAGYEFLVADVFTHQTIARLSAMMDQKEGTVLNATGEQGMLTGFSGLLPIQQWFLNGNETSLSHFNQSVLLGIDKSVTEAELRNALDQLTAHHDALRFIYHRDGVWSQEYGTSKGLVVVEDLQNISPDEIANAIAEKSEVHQRGLNIETGEIVRMALLQTPATDGTNRLLFVIHHLAVDGISWRILLEDLELLLTGFKNGTQTDLGQRSSSYRQWYETLENYGNSKRLKSPQQYWQKAVENYSPLPVDKTPGKQLTQKDISQHSIRLDANRTKALIQQVPKVYHTEINDILMAALATTLCEWIGKNSVVVGLEGHGREEIAEGIDTSRTVGWFTSMYPVLLTHTSTAGIANIIKETKEQLRQVPDKGVGFGVLKYINKEEKFAANKNWDIVFNYFGQLDNVVNKGKWLSGATESKGAGAAEDHVVNELLSVNGMVQAGELIFNWSYSHLHYNPETIIALTKQFQHNLSAIIEHCLQLEGKQVFTPSDYGLGQEITNLELDLFLDEAYKNTTRRESIEGLYRLSGLQSGMFFHSLYNESSGAYIEHLSCDLTGLNLAVFGKSWSQVIKNHSILRSSFHYDAFSIPVQCVYRDVKIPVELVDYRDMNAADQAAAIKLYQEEDRKKGFDFKTAPLMRVGLIRTSEDRYTMVWCFHHILFDGWSLPVLMEEFLTTYELLSSGTSVTTTEEDRYEDYIRYIERGSKNKEETYWRNYMSGVEHATLLPFIANTTEKTKGVGTYKATSIRIEPDLTPLVQNFAQKNRITVNTLMQGIWSCLLHRYTGSADVVYGVIVSGRPDDLPGVEKRIGLYINTLPLHSSIQENLSVVEWLQRLQTGQVASREYQHTPLQSIQAWSGVKGDLFDSILVFENYPISKVVQARKWSLGVENLHTHEQTNYPVTITIGSAEYINIRFRYNSSILPDEYLHEIKDHFEHILWQIVKEEVTVFNKIHLLTPAKELELRVNFNDSQVDYPKDKSVVDLIEEQVVKNPGNIAVEFENEQITYDEFNERANQLAHLLRSKGVKDETLVPLFMERSLEMMVAILGVMKAGAAYVPIDPEYPEDRIRFMLEDTNATVVICSEHSKARLQTMPAIELVTLDASWSEIKDQPVHNLPGKVAAGQLAYVIYTSGSTGRPKGVMIEHSALIDHCYGVIKSAGLHRCRSFALFAPLVFDAGHSMIHSAFLLGASVNVISNRMLTDGEQLAAYLDKKEIDCIKIVPSLWLTYADAGNQVLAKKLMIFGGEGFTATVLDRLKRFNYQADVFNHYGPTEATIGKTIHKVDLQRQYNNIPIGKPFSNTQLYIVDPSLNIVPVGVAGELLIAGDGLARGYLNQPGLTAEKFIKDIFSNGPDARMYKTGDQVRWLPDGNVEYLGRIDDQVKIRGFRIEIGEIDTVLQQSGLVHQSVVVAKEDGNGNKRLVSYIVPNESFSKEAMVTYLRSKLPDYMIPVLWIPLDSLPLNINGKIDKKNLPEPDAADLLSNQYVAPRTELETRLAEIWKEILQVERVGVNDNFFELGGHSLLVMRLISEVRREFKVELAIGTFFELLTIEELANYINVNQSSFQAKFENYDTIKL